MKFEKYKQSHFENCLQLFDKNCPKSFAANERDDYAAYLKTTSDLYQLGFLEGELLAAFGISINNNTGRGRITWIMVCPFSNGKGIGRQMMVHAIDIANKENVETIDISASHLSEPFFEKFGARRIKMTKEGWGPNMHRVDMELKLS